MRWADDMASRRDLDRDWVRQAIGQAHFLPGVPRLMLPPPTGTAKNWRVYRSRFIDPIRIRAGVAFWQANRATLERAAKEYLVPVEIIVGIIGVETVYGQQMGSYRVIDALATLAFDFPTSHPRAAARQEFFRGELEQFLSLSQRTGADPMTPGGQLRGRHGHAPVHAVQRGPVRGGLRRRRPDRPQQQPSRRHRLGGQLLQGVQLAARHAHALRCALRPGAPRQGRPAGPGHPAYLQRRDLHRQGGCARRRGPQPQGRRSRWWNCRMAMRRPATWQARRTSMRSPATTGAATTPWR
jgi:hypothetical protein